MSSVQAHGRHCICGGDHFEPCFSYDAPPEGEIRFQFSSGGRYAREVLRCSQCGHYISVHSMNADALYSEDYVSSTYQDSEGVRKTFDRINALPPEQSDNIGRVKRVIAFADIHFAERRNQEKAFQPTVLDVGSGLGVFLHQMKKANWICTALDPDERTTKHARETIGINAICADFMKASDIGRYDVVTFNKVLEHLEDPVAMLRKAHDNLLPDGFIYIELPDGEGAAVEGKAREEFFIDHLHVFSPASLAILVQRAGFKLCQLERLRDPSGKYTLVAFITE